MRPVWSSVTEASESVVVFDSSHRPPSPSGSMMGLRFTRIGPFVVGVGHM
jgi:hypothetical protein